MKKTLLTSLAFITTLFVNNTPAAIIDYSVNGDDGYFYDNLTGLIWRDIDLYQGLSYQQVDSALVGTGFHIATYDDLNSLYNSISILFLAGIIVVCCHQVINIKPE